MSRFFLSVAVVAIILCIPAVVMLALFLADLALVQVFGASA